MVLLKSKAKKAILISFMASTFHYGSIKIGNAIVSNNAEVQSTFHYGSIKIRWKC